MSGAGRSATEDAGLWGEELAGRYIARGGMKILGRRVRVGAHDEIDLLARDGETLVFVEVKTRASEDFGRPIEAVDRAKRRALCRAAVRYLKAKRFPSVNIRFDVVEVVGSPGCESPSIRHIENAFLLDKFYSLP